MARTGSRELFTLCVVAAAFSIAWGSAKLFDVSFALGAFFVGMVLRESQFSHRGAEESLRLRDAFAVLFFVSVGMLFDHGVLVDEPLKVLAVLAIIVVGKSLAALPVLLFRYPLNTALPMSAGLAQIGEFSFTLAALGLSLGVLSPLGQSLQRIAPRGSRHGLIPRRSALRSDSTAVLAPGSCRVARYALRSKRRGKHEDESRWRAPTSGLCQGKSPWPSPGTNRPQDCLCPGSAHRVAEVAPVGYRPTRGRGWGCSPANPVNVAAKMVRGRTRCGCGAPRSAATLAARAARSA